MDATQVENKPASMGDVNAELSIKEKTFCGLYGGNREAFGWALDVIPRGLTLIGNVVFTNTALLRLARIAAGCQVDLEEGQIELPECTNTVYGIRPSSLLTTLMTAIGICSALLMPIVGATIDHTKYRRAVGRISAIIMTGVTFCQIYISQQTWFFIAICQVISAFFFIVHTLAALAYLPELTDDTNLLTKWTGSFTAIQYGFMTIYLIAVVALQIVFQLEEIQTARLAQSISFVVSSLFFGYSWVFCFKPRPISSQIPENEFLILAGFRKLYKTGKTFVAKNDCLKYFLVSVAFTEAAVSSFTTVAITFMTYKLQFSSNQNGLSIFCLLIGTCPGAWLSTKAAEKWSPVRSFQCALFLWIVNTLVFSFVVKGPEHANVSYIFGFIWGLATGWTYPMERLIYCTIIPKGQEAELMGVYICNASILSWLPPLVFTAMNESGISMNISFASLSFFFLFAFLCQIKVGRNYENAVEIAIAKGKPDDAKNGCADENAETRI